MDLLPGHAHNVTASMMAIDELSTELVDITASITPISFRWKNIGNSQDRRWQSELKLDAAPAPITEEFPVYFEILNPRDKTFKGTLNAVWEGQKVTAPISIAPNSVKSGALKFKVPTDPNVHQIKSDIVATVTAKNGNLVFRRGVEATRHMGLEKSIRLQRVDQYSVGQKPKETDPPVTVRFDADQRNLYVRIETPENFEYMATPDGNPAIRAGLRIDGRPITRRGSIGYVDDLDITKQTVTAGPCKTRSQQGMLGEGYGYFPKDGVKSSFALTGTKGRLTATIPRSYFALYPWKTGSKDSMLGINVWINFLEVTPDQPAGHYPLHRQYILSRSGINANDPEALPVLEMTTKPSTRWNVRIY